MSLPDAGLGQISLSGALPSLIPRMAEGEFTKEVPENLRSVVISNPPYITYRLIGSIELNGIPVLIDIGFEGGVLRSVGIAASSKALGRAAQDWSDWSEAREMQKKALHDQILANAYGRPPYRFAWGEITSSYDPRGGSSDITVRYA